MGHHYAEPHGYRDPIDDVPDFVPKKWVSRRSNTTETAKIDPWAHIPDIKRPANNSSQSRTSSSSEHPKHISASSVVRKKVAELASSQSPTSSPSKTKNVDRFVIMGNEEFIANRILQLSNINELYDACSDPSGAKFQALCAPLIQRLSESIMIETINLKHVLNILKTTLKITIPKE